MKTKLKIALAGTDAEHDAFVDGNKPNERCPLDTFLGKLLKASHGGVLVNDLRAIPLITYSVGGKHVAWFDTSEDFGYIAR